MQHSAFYGRKRGKNFRDHHKAALAEGLPQFGITIADDAPLDITTLFPKSYKQYALEIGFGDGLHLLHVAKTNPDIGYVGVEPYLNGQANVMQACLDGLENIRVYPEDVRFLLKAIPDNTLDIVYLLFPDPWPKKRHHWRRLGQGEVLDSMVRVLKPGGTLYMATDHVDYLRVMLEATQQQPDITWAAKSQQDWQTSCTPGFTTHFQKKALKVGRESTFLTFIKNQI